MIIIMIMIMIMIMITIRNINRPLPQWPGGFQGQYIVIGETLGLQVSKTWHTHARMLKKHFDEKHLKCFSNFY